MTKYSNEYWNNICGQRFGKLIVIGKTTQIKKGRTRLKCQCDCGEIFSADWHRLSSGKTKSCGCYRHEFMKTHGESKSRLHGVWSGMKQRCNNPKTTEYSAYGGRGISVCEAWERYEPFKEWATTYGYRCGLQIDRKDNDGNYEPNNCRWVTPVINMHNMQLIRADNTSGYRGSTYDKESKSWVARVKSSLVPRLHKRGFFSAVDAAKYRDAYCLLGGLPVPMNFPNMAKSEAIEIINNAVSPCR